MEGNLTKGPILKTLTKLAVPIMASSFLGTLYNITDMAWIGLLGSKAVAGVGVGGMFTWLSQGLVSSTGERCSPLQICCRNFVVLYDFYSVFKLQTRCRKCFSVRSEPLIVFT